MSTQIRNVPKAGILALAIAAAATTLMMPSQASAAFGFGGFGHGMMGGFGHGTMGGFGNGTMGGMPHMGGLSHVGGMSRMGKLSNGRGLGAPMQNASPALHDTGKSIAKATNRNVGGGMEERAGTATHSKDGQPIGGSSNFGGTTTKSVSNGNGTHTVTTTDGKGKTTTDVTGNPPAGHAYISDGNGGWKRYEPRKDGPFGPPNSGSGTLDGTTITVTGIGSDEKTVTRTDGDGKTMVNAPAPAVPAAPAPDLGTAIKKLTDAAKAVAAAQAESKSAHISLDSIVNSDDLPDDVKANIPDALKYAADADKNLKAANQNFQKALIDYQLQVLQMSRG